MVKWLKEKSADAEAFYLMGDIFDFWFEYKHVVPRGFTRFLGTISEITDSGIPVYFFTGNHDIWVFDYLPQETGVKLFRTKQNLEINGKKFLIAHGDGLGPYDRKFNFLKKIFTNKALQWAFKRIHPNFSIAFAYRWSKYSRAQHEYENKLEIEQEWLVKYARKHLELSHADFFVFGHRHIPLHYELSEKSQFINLGDWLINFTYGEFDGTSFRIKKYKENDSVIAIEKCTNE